MRVSIKNKLREAMTAHRIAPHKQDQILNAVFFRLSPENVARKDRAAFDDIIHEARNARRAVMSNKSKADAVLAPLYDEYASMLQGVINEVEQAKYLLLKDPDNPRPNAPRIPATLSRISALAKRRADHARDNHLPATPLCNASWPSWIAPSERQRIIDAVDLAYTQLGRTRGRRFVPFATTELIKRTNQAVIRHRAFIEAQRDALAATPTTTKNSSHYKALHLCALRMAELWLDNYERDIKKGFKNPGVDTVPVNWLHLLTHEMRSRVRDADADPSAPIDPTGLTSFLEEDTAG